MQKSLPQDNNLPEFNLNWTAVTVLIFLKKNYMYLHCLVVLILIVTSAGQIIGHSSPGCNGNIDGPN